MRIRISTETPAIVRILRFQNTTAAARRLRNVVLTSSSVFREFDRIRELRDTCIHRVEKKGSGAVSVTQLALVK